MKTALYINGKPAVLENVTRKARAMSFTFAGKTYTFVSHRLPDGSSVLEREIAKGVWQRVSGSVWQSGKDRRIQLGALEAKVTEQVADASHHAGQAELSPKAPMPGLVRQIFVKAGERVKEGQALAVMEAMKLQITLFAGGNAKVEKVLVQVGDMIAEGTELVKLSL